MKRSDIALKKFKEGYNCAQSVIYCFADELCLDKNLALKITSGFGGGIGRKQNVCGAITGGVCVLGMKFGRGENEDKLKQELNYSKIRQFIDQFENKFGTTNCKELINGCELMTLEGLERYEKEHMKEKCCCYIDYAINIIEELISE